MYLTQIVVDLKEAFRQRLVDAYAWHQALWKAFPNHGGKDRDFLIRTEMRRDCHQTLLLSPEAPMPCGWGKWETKDVMQTFLEQETYLFDLRANPVVSKSVPWDGQAPRPRGKRQPILESGELEDWIHRKGESGGFEVDRSQLEIGVPAQQRFRKKGQDGVHTRVDFRGMLTVRDRGTFRAAFRKGIGPAKAFGFGLLMLRPI